MVILKTIKGVLKIGKVHARRFVTLKGSKIEIDSMFYCGSNADGQLTLDSISLKPEKGKIIIAYRGDEVVFISTPIEEILQI